jgi:hypothetical protein
LVGLFFQIEAAYLFTKSTDLSTAKLAVGGSPSEIHVQLKRTVAEMREKALLLPLLEMDSFLEQVRPKMRMTYWDTSGSF